MQNNQNDNTEEKNTKGNENYTKQKTTKYPK